MRPILFLSMLLLAASWVVAQDTSSQPADPGSTNSASQNNMNQTATGGSQTTVEGCLAGADGKYTLTDSQGKMYNLTGDTSKLSEHVGHTVKITGMQSSGSEAGASGEMSGGSMAGGMSLQVSSVKHISKTCKNAGGGMSH